MIQLKYLSDDLFGMRMLNGDVYAIRQALYAACFLSKLTDAEYERRVGLTQAQRRDLLKQYDGVLGKQSCTDETRFRSIALSRDELLSMVRVISEACNGVGIPEWEFHTLLGVERAEMRRVVEQLHLLLVTAKPQLLKLIEADAGSLPPNDPPAQIPLPPRNKLSEHGSLRLGHILQLLYFHRKSPR